MDVRRFLRDRVERDSLGRMSTHDRALHRHALEQWRTTYEAYLRSSGADRVRLRHELDLHTPAADVALQLAKVYVSATDHTGRCGDGIAEFIARHHDGNVSAGGRPRSILRLSSGGYERVTPEAALVELVNFAIDSLQPTYRRLQRKLTVRGLSRIRLRRARRP